MSSESLQRALPSVFPWVRHLSEDELKQFVSELIGAMHDAAQSDVHAHLHRVVVEWRATARVLADPELTALLTRRLPDIHRPSLAQSLQNTAPPQAR